jgi:formamidopyrimidine-DNA glycosylase
MTQIFSPSANPLSKVSIALAVIAFTALAVGAVALYRSDYVTGVNDAVAQPVPFSHRHHVSGAGIDCRYCHSTVETSAFAGIPSTDTCMTCHQQIWSDSPTLEPVRESYRTDRSIEWNRVHDLPDYVYFDHSIHIYKGIGCVTCHGHVNEMPLVARKQSLFMEWCLGCHRAPERYVRPREQVFDMDWQPSEDQLTLGGRLVKEYQIQKLTDCYTCHR